MRRQTIGVETAIQDRLVSVAFTLIVHIFLAALLLHNASNGSGGAQRE